MSEGPSPGPRSRGPKPVVVAVIVVIAAFFAYKNGLLNSRSLGSFSRSASGLGSMLGGDDEYRPSFHDNWKWDDVVPDIIRHR
jgi:hypothetical protein